MDTPNSPVMEFIFTLNFRSCCFYLLFGGSLLLNLPFRSAAQTAIAKNKILSNSNGRIFEERFIKINGIDQWVSIKGNRSKPAILFLHGGPGSPLSPYSEAIYGEWEKDFIIVQWDQRGTGKTYGRNAPAELNEAFLKSNPLTVQQMTSDGIRLTEYLIKYLGKQKIILFGTSWGSELGVLMATERPDIFCAYIGHSQVVDPYENFKAVYKKIFSLAENAHDQKSLNTLKKLGSPPYDSARNYGQLLRIVKAYEKQNSLPVPDSLWKISSAYTSTKDEQDRSDGDDYSFINYTGDTPFGIRSMMKSVNMIQHGLEFKIPVYLIQGEEDILTSKEITKEYFDQIRAPKKEYILIPKTAHGFNVPVIEMQYKIMKRIYCE